MDSDTAQESKQLDTKEEHMIDIGEEKFIIDPNSKDEEEDVLDEIVYSPETKESMNKQLDEPTNSIPDPRGSEWLRTTERIRRHEDPRDNPTPAPQNQRLCKNDTCVNLVPKSKNPGVERLFCCPRCNHRYHARKWAQRNYTKTGWSLTTDGSRQVKFERVKPTTTEIAESRYNSHLEDGMCPNATNEFNNRCPGRINPYSKPEETRCLIYGTMVDDMKETWARARLEFYIRQYTTNDGRWIDESELAPHIDARNVPMNRIGHVPEQIRGRAPAGEVPLDPDDEGTIRSEPHPVPDAS